MAASRKQIEELQKAHDQKIKEQKILDEKRKVMESQQTKVRVVQTDVGTRYLHCWRKVSQCFYSSITEYKKLFTGICIR